MTRPKVGWWLSVVAVVVLVSVVPVSAYVPKALTDGGYYGKKTNDGYSCSPTVIAAASVIVRQLVQQQVLQLTPGFATDS
jgi:hypothetical protein